MNAVAVSKRCPLSARLIPVPAESLARMRSHFTHVTFELQTPMTSIDAQSALRDAMTCHERGALYDAELHYAEALQLDPANARAWRLRGILHRERGDVATALRYLAQAHDLDPDNPEPLMQTGITCMLAGDLQAAEDALREARILAPNAIDTLANLAALLQHRGHLHESALLYREILAQDESEIEIRCNLAKALSDAGRHAEALAEADHAVQLSDGTRGSLATRGAILIDNEDYAAAATTLAEATAREPDDMALVNLALCASRAGDRQQATTHLLQALELNPHNARAAADLIDCLSATGDDTAALDLAEQFLQAHPAERLVTGSYAQALANAGKTDAARELTDCGKLVQVFDLAPPSGWDSADEFHAALAAELLDDASLLANPVSKSTRGGEQTGELNLHGSPALQAFAVMMHRTVFDAAESYRAAGLQQHPVMQPAREHFTLRAWGTVIHAGGRQVPHMHPLGWLSAVYYVALPDRMNATDGQAGWLEFGQPPARMHCAQPPNTIRYEPKTGRLIVFPSWFWHSTLPFGTASATAGDTPGPRISIAFDAMPAQQLRAL